MVSTVSQLEMPEKRELIQLYQYVRGRTMQIVAPLEIEDYVIQTAEFMSPPRWHIGHTSWFFETVLRAHQPGYKVYSEDYLFYFNSYYEGFGARIERPKRGTKSRPTVRETVAYRHHVDEQMLRFLERTEDPAVLSLVRLGLEHEMQHQELLVYDIKHLLCDQFDAPIQTASTATVKVEGMAEIEGGLFWLGYGDRVSGLRFQVPSSTNRGSSPTVREGSESISLDNQSGDRSPHSKNYEFAFDNEKPAHQIFLQDFAIDRALVSNGEFLEFIQQKGYQDFRWWFSEGWETVNRERWRAPMYWEWQDGGWMIRDFAGLHEVTSKANEPVSHVSFYEASAFAKWAGKRLPTEVEWEKAARFSGGKSAVVQPPATAGGSDKSLRDFPWGDEMVDVSKANLFENGLWGPAPIGAFPAGQNAFGCQQMIGDVWEWTTSDYVPYPGFKSEFDEYNDKWFVNQKVLRGGSYATPQLHIRSTYRNFFHAHERWMTSGFRCAKDL